MRLLKIHTLPPAKDNWIDKDYIMLHACFQLLVDFVEQEDGLNHCNYEHHKETIDELQYLYDWWKNSNSKLKDDKTNQENLLRLIKQREFLWT